MLLIAVNCVNCVNSVNGVNVWFWAHETPNYTSCGAGLEEAIRQSLEALQERMSSQAMAEIPGIPGCPVAAYGTTIMM